MSDNQPNFDPQPPIFTEPSEPQPGNTSSPNQRFDTPEAGLSGGFYENNANTAWEDEARYEQLPNGSGAGQPEMDSNLFQSIPSSVFQEDSTEYDEMQDQISKGANASKMSLTFGCVALGLMFVSFCASCCCCLGYIGQIAGLICAIIGLVYGIIGIKRTHEYATDTNAIIGTVLSSIVLVLMLAGFIISLISLFASYSIELLSFLSSDYFGFIAPFI